MFDPFFDLIAKVLAFFYSLYPSYGLAVVGLTLIVMLVVTPLTLKSTRSMLQMQRLQPELKSIQKQYKDDRQKMNEELMAFYQENGINPLGGCLPLLVQMPVFLVLFRVVQGINRRITDFGLQAGWTSGRGSRSSNQVTPIRSSDLPFDPENLPVDSEMYLDLTGSTLPYADRPTEMVSWTIDLSRSTQSVLGESFVSALPYLLLIVVVLVSSLYQQKQIRGRNTGASINPQQEMIMKILPWMLPVFSFTMPAALVVYFVVSNIYRIGQQSYITRSLYSGEESLGAQARRSRETTQAKGSSGNSKAIDGRITGKKGQATPKRNEAKAGKSKAGKGKVDKGKAKKAKSKGSGAGRTGKAPSRHHPQGGRTTNPGSPQHKKRKR